MDGDVYDGLRLRPDILKVSADGKKAEQKQQIVEFITAKKLRVNQC
ncbi:hypothetical protein [Nostoc sp.]